MSDLCLSDLVQHVVKFGIDVYPPIEISSDRTRLNMLFESAREHVPKLYERLLASDTEFRISKQFRTKPDVPGPSTWVDTLVLTPRGPVFVYPFLLPGIGETGLEPEYLALFKEVRKLFGSCLPGRKFLRVGLIRELTFFTGKALCTDVLSDQPEFAGAHLAGGSLLLAYRDEKCNVRIKLETAEVMKTTRLPIGQTVTEVDGHALTVHLDVNNREIRPLDDSDIDVVLDRATSLWPDELLEYLQKRRAT